MRVLLKRSSVHDQVLSLFANICDIICPTPNVIFLTREAIFLTPKVIFLTPQVRFLTLKRRQLHPAGREPRPSNGFLVHRQSSFLPRRGCFLAGDAVKATEKLKPNEISRFCAKLPIVFVFVFVGASQAELERC